MFTIKIEGLSELVKTLDDVRQLRFVKAALKAAARHIEAKVKKYPPATAANSPAGPGRGWYERGYGSRYMTVLGQVRGRKTSEMLGRSWSTREEDDGLTQIIGTPVSYARYVHDIDQQSRFHFHHGWKTIQYIAEQEAPVLRKKIMEYLEKVLG